MKETDRLFLVSNNQFSATSWTSPVFKFFNSAITWSFQSNGIPLIIDPQKSPASSVYEVGGSNKDCMIEG
jgi:hypothetical protein